MKHPFLAIILAFTVPAAAVGAADVAFPTLDLMPVPAQIEIGTGTFMIGDDFNATIDGDGATPRLHRGVLRMLRRLSDRSAVFFSNSTFLELAGRENPAMKITAGRAAEPAVGVDESYRLTVTETGIELQAATDIGALRGLQTFLQLLILDERGVAVPEVVIFDDENRP